MSRTTIGRDLFIQNLPAEARQAGLGFGIWNLEFGISIPLAIYIVRKHVE
jgi:hypothetical protein